MNNIDLLIRAFHTTPDASDWVERSRLWAFILSLEEMSPLFAVAKCLVQSEEPDLAKVLQGDSEGMVGKVDVEIVLAELYGQFANWEAGNYKGRSTMAEPPQNLYLTSLAELGMLLDLYLGENTVSRINATVVPRWAAELREDSARLSEEIAVVGEATTRIDKLESISSLDQALAWVVNAAAGTLRVFKELTPDTFSPPLSLQEALDTGVEEDLIGFQKILIFSLFEDRERHRVPDALKPAFLAITAMRSGTQRGGFLYTFNALVEGVGESSSTVRLAVGFICGQKSSGLRELNPRSISATPITVEATDPSPPVFILQIYHE